MKRYKVTLITLLAVSTNLSAQIHMSKRDSAMTERTVKMGPVVVTGGGHHQHLREAATPVHVITQRDITQTGASTFQDVVTRLMPQVSVAPNSMGSFLRMNGLGNKYVLVLVNGKRVIGDISVSSCTVYSCLLCRRFIDHRCDAFRFLKVHIAGQELLLSTAPLPCPLHS